MSFQRIQSFLPRAFKKLDRKHSEVHGTTNTTIQKIIGCDDVEYRGGSVIVYSGSAVLKQQIHNSKDTFIKKINSHFPHLRVTAIVFKGPRS